MRDVVVKAGVYGRRDEKGRVLPVAKGERVTLPDEEAARLAALGVAIYVDAPAQTAAPPSGVAEPLAQPMDTSGEKPPTEAATGDAEGGGAEAEVTRLERMPKVDLERMAQDMGVDISGAKNKHDLAILIVAAGAGDDDEPPPDLDAGDIVA